MVCSPPGKTGNAGFTRVSVSGGGRKGEEKREKTGVNVTLIPQKGAVKKGQAGMSRKRCVCMSGKGAGTNVVCDTDEDRPGRAYAPACGKNASR